jgi:hypothetical protein
MQLNMPRAQSSIADELCCDDGQTIRRVWSTVPEHNIRHIVHIRHDAACAVRVSVQH